MIPFLKKYIAQIKRTAGILIPYNLHYRPHSIYQLNLNDVHVNAHKEALVYTVYPKHVTSLSVPEDLLEVCLKHSPTEREVETDYAVVEVPNGRIYADEEGRVAVISKYNRIIDNVSVSLKGEDGKAKSFNCFFEQRYFHDPLQLKGVVFSMLAGGNEPNNICHWFLDVLPRLHLLKESGLYDLVDWFLVPELKHDYQSKSLELLGIPKDKIITADTNPHIKADSVIVATAPRGNQNLVPVWLCKYIQDAFSAPEVEDNAGNDKVYLASNGHTTGSVQNETELIDVLERHNLSLVKLHDMSFGDVVQFLSNAKTVVSATNEKLIYLLLCKQGTKVIELCSENEATVLYADIATKLGLDYNYLVCKSQKRGIDVDVAEISALLKQKKEVKSYEKVQRINYEI